MATKDHYFVEWKEQYVSKERGNRVVHYFLKDNSGESILAVVGTERSVRHMFYVVSEEFLSVHGADSSIGPGFRWRSRREVVNWLTSMLSKQHRRGDYAISPKDSLVSEVNAQLIQMPPYKGRSARNLKDHHLDIYWSGTAWACGKFLKHYPAFRRNGISIAVQSFVFVMAEKENRHIAYLEDMYEDRKCQKKVKVRWFHHNKEVKGVVSLRNPHPKELFITPYIQVISAECVDGPAVVLTHEHYEKCQAVFPNDLLNGVHFCFRQFKSNRIKPFRLSRLRGYFDQPIFSCFSADFFEEDEFSSEEDVKVGAKRSRSYGEHYKSAYAFPYKRCGLLNEEPNFLKHDESNLQEMPIFAANEKVEFLCQDSGLRGCWFRCMVLEVSRRQMKIRYDDVKDEDTGTHLEEWVPTCRIAKSDKLGMRCSDRPRVRPTYPCDERSGTFEVGVPADAWWSDGWWEGVISSNTDAKKGIYKIYIPGENLYLDVELKNLRASRDWVGDRWVDIKSNPKFCAVISTEDVDKIPSPLHSIVPMEVEFPNSHSPSSFPKFAASPKQNGIEEDIHDLPGMELMNVPLKEECSNNEQQRALQNEENDHYFDHSNQEEKQNANFNLGGSHVDKGPFIVDHVNRSQIDSDDEENNLVDCEISLLKCEDDTIEMLTE